MRSAVSLSSTKLAYRRASCISALAMTCAMLAKTERKKGRVRYSSRSSSQRAVRGDGGRGENLGEDVLEGLRTLAHVQRQRWNTNVVIAERNRVNRASAMMSSLNWRSERSITSRFRLSSSGDAYALGDASPPTSPTPSYGCRR